jgi:hypothetical protein
MDINKLSDKLKSWNFVYLILVVSLIMNVLFLYFFTKYFK